MLSQKALQDFKKIWQEEFGEKISDESATGKAVNLLTLFDAIYRPIRKIQMENLDKGNQN